MILFPYASVSLQFTGLSQANPNVAVDHKGLYVMLIEILCVRW